MVLKYRDKEISSQDDIQNLTAKNLREILRSYSESTGGVKADLVLKVYALLMRKVLPSSANNKGLEKDSLQDQGDFKYEATIRSCTTTSWYPRANIATSSSKEHIRSLSPVNSFSKEMSKARK